MIVGALLFLQRPGKESTYADNSTGLVYDSTMSFYESSIRRIVDRLLESPVLQAQRYTNAMRGAIIGEWNVRKVQHRSV